jgi:hypothetical protein
MPSTGKEHAENGVQLHFTREAHYIPLQLLARTSPTTPSDYTGTGNTGRGREQEISGAKIKLTAWLDGYREGRAGQAEVLNREVLLRIWMSSQGCSGHLRGKVFPPMGLT